MNDPIVYQKRFFYFIFISSFCFLLIGLTLYFSSIKNVFLKEDTVIFESLSNILLDAQSVYILDTNSGDVIFEKDATTLRPIASITKVMTALVASRVLSQEESVPARLPNAFYKEGVVENLFLSEHWSLEELIKLMLTKSSNEAAEALEDFSFKKDINLINEMNETARFLGLWKAVFYNTTGLDINEKKAGAYATAEEVAYLFKYTLHQYPNFFEPTRLKGYNTKSEEGTVYFIENTNQLAPYLQGLVASKTGYTDLAGGNLVFALQIPFQEEKKTIIIALLGSTKDGRFSDAEKITQALLKDFKNSR